MSSSYASIYFIAGRRAGPIKQIINDMGCDDLKQYNVGNCKSCICPSPINNKIIKNSNPDVIPGTTQRERVVNAIKYVPSGQIVYGNPSYNYKANGVALLGRIQGQPVPTFFTRNRF
jgi:hypothetical protein